MLLTEKEAKVFTDKILSLVAADDASVNVNSNSTSHLRFAANSFLTSGTRETRSASVTLWIGGRRGSASTNDLDDASLRAMVENAERIAKTAPPDREYMPTLGKQVYRDSGGYVEATANLALDKRAKAIANIIAECEKSKVIGAGFHSAGAQAVAFATKNGNFNFSRSTIVSLSVSARTIDGSASGYFSRNHFNIAKLDTMRIAREAIQKALSGSDPKTIDPGVYNVILEPQATADLLGNLGFSFNARNAEEGRSVYSAPGGKTRLGEKIFDERINIFSDPWNPELPGSESTQEGIPAEKFYLVRNGVLENLVYNRFWAKQKGKQPSPGPVNTILQSSAPPSSLEEMIKTSKRTILIGRFWYIRSTDPRTASLTGLTRDGVWLIEDGKISYPLRNLRFNQSITQMLGPNNVEMIGAPERVGGSEGGGGSLLPALRLKAFNFTSQSEAV